VDIQYYEKYEPAALKDPLDVVEIEEEDFGTEILEPTTQAEPPSAPPLLVKLPVMGLASGKKNIGVLNNGGGTNSTNTVNIPLFCVSGHLMHDAATSYQWLSSEALVSSSTIRFAQKFSTNVLVTINTSARSDGLVKHYGVPPHAVDPPAAANPAGLAPEKHNLTLPAHVPSERMHALHRALLGEKKVARTHATSVEDQQESLPSHETHSWHDSQSYPPDESIGAQSSSASRLGSPNSSRRNIDISFFTD